MTNLEFGNFDNIDANTTKKFKTGEFRIEAELDLHGYTEKSAFDAVINFVKQSYIQGKRCITIITGKGLHRDNDDCISNPRGVLKEWVPKWLNFEDIRPLILAVNHPAPNQGGDGVIKILLRRKRS